LIVSSSQLIYLHDIGPATFYRSSRAKYLNISLRPFSGIRVAVPRRMSFKKAEYLVRQKKTWILKHLAKNRVIEAEYAKTREKFADLDINAAREYLTQRIKFLADQHGFCYSRIYIRSQRTRWGSCSANNSISLNAGLLLLPSELQDYVILHELVHTRIKNHSSEFWLELKKYVGPDISILRKQLKQFPILR